MFRVLRITCVCPISTTVRCNLSSVELITLDDWFTRESSDWMRDEQSSVVRLWPMRRFQIISDYRDEIYECLSTNECTIRCCDAIYDWTLRMVNDTLPWTCIDDSYETVHWSFTDESDASLYKCLEIMLNNWRTRTEVSTDRFGW